MKRREFGTLPLRPKSGHGKAKISELVIEALLLGTKLKWSCYGAAEPGSVVAIQKRIAKKHFRVVVMFQHEVSPRWYYVERTELVEVLDQLIDKLSLRI